MNHRGRLRALSWLALSGMGLSMFAGCSPDKPAFRAIDITGADYASGFSLPDQHGKPRTLADFKGRIVVVFFGFTQCPDVCPTTMAEMVEVKKALGADGQRVQGIFVTVDPERDTADVLKAYMANFGPDFVALRPDSPQQLADLARHYKVYYKKVDGKTPGSYSMDHTAGSYVYDTQGRIRLYTRYGSGAQALTEDIRILLRQA